MSKVNFSHPANQKYLSKHGPFIKPAYNFQTKDECDPASIDQVELKLGMHAEVVRIFWNEITKDLPEDCRWIVRGRAVLVRPKNGVIFGFQATNISFALRLPQTEKAVAINSIGHLKMDLSAGGTYDVNEYGDDWVLFYAKGSDSLRRFCLESYRYAGNLQMPEIPGYRMPSGGEG
ncbi:MAG TPA: hypothetical protein PLL75_04705 [Candidatus Omnitrophota bacterium]|nr:hypothetical protein [Candidatus Omnitrophota bacterium]HPS37012.1 hypothetical protein [Candidatus Omnitrophota bacterium]